MVELHVMAGMSGGHPENVTILAISGPQGGGGETAAPRIHELLGMFSPNSYWADIEGSDYAGPLGEALEVIDGSCGGFIPPVG